MFDYPYGITLCVLSIRNVLYAARGHGLSEAAAAHRHAHLCSRPAMDEGARLSRAKQGRIMVVSRVLVECSRRVDPRIVVAAVCVMSDKGLGKRGELWGGAQLGAGQ